MFRIVTWPGSSSVTKNLSPSAREVEDAPWRSPARSRPGGGCSAFDDCLPDPRPLIYSGIMTNETPSKPTDSIVSENSKRQLALGCWYLTGATASGKTGISLALAELLDAEIISLDSMAIYRGMDVGTAKPSLSAAGPSPASSNRCR